MSTITLTTDDWRSLAVLLHLVVVLILGGIVLAVAPLVVHTAHHHRLVDGLERKLNVTSK